MLLKKINKYFFTLILLLTTSFSQDFLPSSIISLSDIRSIRNFSPDLIALYGEQLAFIDKENRTLGMYAYDSLRVIGGYGSSEYSFIDPIDIIIDELDVMVLDESEGKVSRFDLNLNFIQFYDLLPGYPIYPSVFSIDSRRNIYFFSPDDDILYRRDYSSKKINKFIDYSSNTKSPGCLLDVYINQNDQIGTLFDCSNELHIYNRSGRLQIKYKIELKNPQKSFFINGNWSVIDTVGRIQVSNGLIFDLFIDKKTVLDSYINQNNLYVLTKNKIYIFDSTIFPK